jgi:DNA polymerase III sliding clamp (beta) subunit (PCNA family)
VIDRKNAVEATISADKLDAYLEGIHALVEEAKLRFDTDGVHCYAKDPANVAFVESYLDELHFSNYDAVECVIGVPLRKIRSVLELLEGDIEVSVNVAEEEIAFDDGDAEFETEYIDPDTIRKADTERAWTKTTEVYVSGDELHRAVTLASEVDDHVELVYNAETETLSAFSNEDKDYSNVEISTEATPQNNGGTGHYSIDYFSDFTEAIPSGTGVAIGLGDDVPLELGVANEGIETDYVLAPRIRGDD